MADEIPKGLFCVWGDEGENWRCLRCGAAVPKSVTADRPFAGCKRGMGELGVTPTDLVQATPRASIPQHGPGTELKRLLGKIGIKATPNCSCNRRALQMDLWGADVCEAKQDEIVGWLREEAGKRKLPFIEMAARKIVQWAIDRARNKSDATKM